MTERDIPANLIQSKLIINLLEKKISAMKEPLFALFQELGGGIPDQDLLVFLILFAV